MELNHVRSEVRCGVLEELRVRALVVDVSVGDAQRRVTPLRERQDVLGFVVVG